MYIGLPPIPCLVDFRVDLITAAPAVCTWYDTQEMYRHGKNSLTKCRTRNFYLPEGFENTHCAAEATQQQQVGRLR